MMRRRHPHNNRHKRRHPHNIRHRRRCLQRCPQFLPHRICHRSQKMMAMRTWSCRWTRLGWRLAVDSCPLLSLALQRLPAWCLPFPISACSHISRGRTGGVRREGRASDRERERGRERKRGTERKRGSRREGEHEIYLCASDLRASTSSLPPFTPSPNPPCTPSPHYPCRKTQR